MNDTIRDQLIEHLMRDQYHRWGYDQTVDWDEYRDQEHGKIGDDIDAILLRFGVVELPEPTVPDGDLGPSWCTDTYGVTECDGDLLVRTQYCTTRSQALGLAAAIVAACRTAQKTKEAEEK